MTGAAAMRERAVLAGAGPVGLTLASGDPAPVAAMAAARPEAARAHRRGSAMLDTPSHDAEGAIPHG